MQVPGWTVLGSESLPVREPADEKTLVRFRTGVGPAAVCRSFAALPNWSFTGALLGGFAGALERDLEPGTVVVADRVLDTAGRSYTPPLAAQIEACARRAGLPVRRGALVSVDRVVADAASKRALAERSGACAVDMESVTLAELLVSRGIPFGVGRVVLDRAQEELPPSASVMSALGWIVRSGSLTKIPGMLRIGARVGRCARVGARLIEAWTDSEPGAGIAG